MSRMTIIEALCRGEVQLAQAGVETPRLDADLLLAFVLGLRRDQLYLERDLAVEPDLLDCYLGLLARRAKREPLQYLVQKQEFMGLEFFVDRRVLIPRADSEILVEAWLGLTADQGPKLRVLDVCTGSGALAIAMGYYRQGNLIVGTDLSDAALEVARANARRHGVQAEFRCGDLVEPAAGEQWDWIVSNPPYVSVAEYVECTPEIRYEPLGAFLGGQDGLDFYRRLKAEALPLLAPGGQLLLEIGWRQAAAVCQIFAEDGCTTRVFQDLGGRDRVILVR